MFLESVAAKENEKGHASMRKMLKISLRVYYFLSSLLQKKKVFCLQKKNEDIKKFDVLVINVLCS